MLSDPRLVGFILCWMGLTSFLFGQDVATLQIGGQAISLRRDYQSLAVHFREPTRLADLPGKQAHLRSVMEPGRRVSWTALTWTGAGKAPNAEHLLQAAGIDPATVARVSYGWQTEAGVTFWFDQRISYRLAPGATRADLQAWLATYPGTALAETPTGLPYVQVRRDRDIVPLAQALQASGLVQWCQPEFRSPASSNTVRQIQGPDCPTTDSLLGDQYYLDNTVTSAFGTATYPYWTPSQAGTDIHALSAWCLSKGNSGITVALLDEGVEAHEDLEDGNGNSRVIGGYYTDPIYSGNGEPVNSGDAHGQAVAGIVAASHNDKGGSGVAPNVNLLSVWIEKGAGGSDLQRADGIRWAYQNGADIILNAWTFFYCPGSGLPSQPLEDAIDSAQVYGRNRLGSLVVFSSGYIFNDGDPTCVRYPASLADVLTVGAVGPGGDVYPQQGRSGAGALPPNYAPYGPEIDLVGVSGYSRSNSFISAMDRMGNLGYNAGSVTYQEYSNRNYTMYFGGTSSASAQIAGIAALMLDVNSSLTHQDLMSMLTGSAVDIGPTGTDARFGAGIANAYAAVQMAQNSLPVEWGRFTGEPQGERVRLRWETLTEVNNDRFVVERNTGDGFVPIGEVPGAGTSARVQRYEFVDQAPLPGVNVYRLQQIDLDGQSDYSNQVEVRYLPAQRELSGVRPNPAREQLAFDVYGQQRQAVYYQLTNLQGQVLRQGKAVVNDAVYPFQVSVADLAPGLYILQVRNDDFVLGTRRVLIQR